ncbi:hypothetical protein [Ruminococcus sp. Marseille-P6503]|uniref:hypothetical protein n=1 Tax=Ruminococcus sp. Marseille-P6503 TaxID=2364796 RepID=UPI000F52BDAA|nr:hypothetical protein [Ruminococcus sp. Marseille-P6503]
MPSKLGITATELFACNPFRILGVPVNASQSEINDAYAEILKLNETGAINGFVSPFDFSSLPPFSRDIGSVKNAYAKLASNGYRCFAYADSQFTAALNIDDVALNLRDISCYDCFLRCYMWLVINDGEMEETQLWIQLAEYIDRMIASTSDNWTKYFDDRFPAEMIDRQLTVYKSFYTTFCEIILLPIKELVRGSMKCRTATDILKAKGINFNEEFPYIEIPQANIPKDGEKPPKLKIALKDGDEYFDISSGKMVSFESENNADIENNEFSVASAPIKAESIIAAADESDAADEDNHSEQNSFGSQNEADISSFRTFSGPDYEDDEEYNEPKLLRKPITFKTFHEEDDDSYIQNPPEAENDAVNKQSAPEVKTAPKLKIKKNRTSLIDNSDYIEGDSTDIVLTDEPDEENNLYTEALIQMLRANRSKNQMMKDVDTRRVFDNGDSLKNTAEAELTMDDINMKKYDSSLLASPYETDNSGEANKISREEKFRNIKIDDMLNPSIGGKTSRDSFEPDAIEEFKKQKQQKKASVKSLVSLSVILAVCCIVYVLLRLNDII